MGTRHRPGARRRHPRHPRHPPRDHHLLLDRRPALAAVPAGHRRQRGLAPLPGRPRQPRPARRRPDPNGSRLPGRRRRAVPTGARQCAGLDEPAAVVLRHLPDRRRHRRDHSAPGAGRPRRHRAARPGRRTGFPHRAGRRRHRRDLRDRHHYWAEAAPTPHGRRGAPDGRPAPAGHRGREGPARRVLPGLRRPATGAHRPGDRREDRRRRRRRPRPRHQRHHAARGAAAHGLHQPAHRRGPRRPLRRRPPARRGHRPALRRGLRRAAEAVRRRTRHPLLRRVRAALDRDLRPRPRPVA